MLCMLYIGARGVRLWSLWLCDSESNLPRHVLSDAPMAPMAPVALVASTGLYTGMALSNPTSTENFHFENNANYRLQGNGRYEGAAHRLKREQLKKSKFIERSVSSLGAAMGKHEDETATCDEYIAIHVRISACLAPDLSRSERREAAAEEWANDAAGKSTMSFGQFTNAMHEMADLWTEDVSEVEYKYFLDKLHSRITARKDAVVAVSTVGTARADSRADDGSVGTAYAVVRIADGSPCGKSGSTDAEPGAVAQSSVPGSSGSRTEPLVRRGGSTANGPARAASSVTDGHAVGRAPPVKGVSTQFTLRSEADVVSIGTKPRAERRDSSHEDTCMRNSSDPSRPPEVPNAPCVVSAAPLLGLKIVGQGKHRRWTHPVIFIDEIAPCDDAAVCAACPFEPLPDAATLPRGQIPASNRANVGELVKTMAETITADPPAKQGNGAVQELVVSGASRRTQGQRGFVGRLCMAVDAASHGWPGHAAEEVSSTDSVARGPEPADARPSHWWQPSAIANLAASLASPRASVRVSVRVSGRAASSRGASVPGCSHAGVYNSRAEDGGAARGNSGGDGGSAEASRADCSTDSSDPSSSGSKPADARGKAPGAKRQTCSPLLAELPFVPCACPVSALSSPLPSTFISDPCASLCASPRASLRPTTFAPASTSRGVCGVRGVGGGGGAVDIRWSATVAPSESSVPGAPRTRRQAAGLLKRGVKKATYLIQRTSTSVS